MMIDEKCMTEEFCLIFNFSCMTAIIIHYKAIDYVCYQLRINQID